MTQHVVLLYPTVYIMPLKRLIRLLESPQVENIESSPVSDISGIINEVRSKPK